jgi:hypothetical protein
MVGLNSINIVSEENVSNNNPPTKRTNTGNSLSRTRKGRPLHESSNLFEAISERGIMSGCIGVIDGWLLPIVTPSKIVGNVCEYFSGHYHRFSVNIQAAVDAQLRFVFMAIAAPGGQPDYNAYLKTILRNLLEALPIGYFLIGDNAYPASSEHLIPIYGGLSRLNADNGNFN